MTALAQPGAVRVERSGAVRVLVMEHPPLNTLVHGIRAGLMAELLAAELDDATGAVVLAGAGGSFCGGADLDEFARGTAMAAPSLHGHLIPFIEAMTKPVVAAVRGFALGGGLELALGCHARIASAGAQVGLPETNFGLIPGAGGTVRLPRAVGMERAARMIVTAEVVAAADLAGTALFALVCDGDALAEAVALARALAARGGPLPRLCDRAVPPFDPERLGAVAALDRPSPRATRVALRSLRRAAERPVAEALAEEYADFAGLLTGDESAALRHLFLAERAAQKVPDAPAPARVTRVEIAGEGALADALRAAAAAAGLEAGPGGVRLATGDAPGPVRVAAAVPGSRLVEVVRSADATPDALAAAMAALRRMRRLPVLVADRPGLLVEPVLRPYIDAARGLMARGVSPARIDPALETFGVRRGPVALMAALGEAPPDMPGNGAAVTDGTITLTCILALVNAAAKALDEGAALRPGDIDLALVEAAGFPARLGGPLFWAETRGRPLTLVQIDRLHRGGDAAAPAAWFRAGPDGPPGAPQPFGRAEQP